MTDPVRDPSTRPRYARLSGLAAVSDRDVQPRCLVVPGLDLQAFLEESAAGARDRMFLGPGALRVLARDT